MKGAVLIGAGILALVSAGTTGAAGAEGAALRSTIEEQGRVIQELRATIQELKQSQAKSQDRIRALEDEGRAPAVSAAPASGVTPEWVDQRIQQFQTSDESRFLLSGYGSTTFKNQNSSSSTFETQFNPIFQYRMTDKLHFAGELEFELDERGATQLELEFGTIDYLLKDWLTVSAGKFLTPFNAFGPRLHPAWINKMASKPLLYEKFKNGGIIGIPTDVGVMLSGGNRLFDSESKFDYAVYVGNGPSMPNPTLPRISFDNTPDENANKTAGGRLGFLPIPNLELGASYMTGETKGKNSHFQMVGADAWYHLGGLELRGELIRLSRQGRNMGRLGYYLQAAYRLSGLIPETTGWRGFVGRMEPVIRWAAVDKNPHRRQLAFGLDYWLFPSVPLKFTYEINDGAISDNKILFQLAYGF